MHFFKKCSIHSRPHNACSHGKSNFNNQYSSSNHYCCHDNNSTETSYVKNYTPANHNYHQDVRYNNSFDYKNNPIDNFEYFKTL